MSPQLELSAFLAAVRRRWRWLTALRAGTTAMLGVAAALGTFALVFRLVRPAAEALLAFALLAVVFGLAWVVRAVKPALRRPDDRRLARFVEERQPAFEDSLVTAVEARDRQHVFSDAIARAAAVHARDAAPGAIVPHSDMRRAAGHGLAACALLLVAGGASIAPLEQALQAAWVRLFPSRVAIALEPGNRRVVAGDAVTLRARLTGLPADFDARPVAIVEGGAASRREAMVKDGDSYVHHVPAAAASFRYSVSAAGRRSSEYEITVLHRPALERIDLAYEYPSYTGMPARVEEDGGDVYAPAGTRVTLRVRGDKALRSGTLRIGSRELGLSPGSDPHVREASFVVERDGSYRVQLADADGLQSEPSSEYFVRVTDDRPPDVRIVRPEGDRQVTALEEVEIRAQAEDDYKVGSLELVYAVGGGPERAVPLSRSAAPSVGGGHLLLIEDLDVRPGDMVRAYARAREARKGGRVSRSEMLLLDVIPFDQQFTLAQSQAGAGGGDGDVESLIEAQKNIVNATWNLLRRAAAGRSDADVKALAAAQGELKGRAQAQAPMAPPVTGSPGPTALAAAAMGRAEGELQRKRLQEAVPHEMEALTQLGRALAEIREREVTQQRGGRGGRGNRSSQDLSALFDRELLRQQQTNYETPQQASSRERRDANAEADLQKRIRELAARQDALAREQRRLAQQRLAEAERKRQLERLTREQEELRREAEQLARDLQRQQGQNAREQTESLREAADEMRAASGDMRRNDADGASERGNRAAERLRGAEQQTADEGSAGRSLGELQMEAQQLAEAQRRLEGRQDSERGAPGRTRTEDPQGRAGSGGARPGTPQESEQQAPAARGRGERPPETAGADGADERRQIAEEQRRLAERAERLERSARATASSADDQRARQAAGQAARDLQRGRVADRMRENARAMQAGQPTPRGELSETLDRVAGRLGAAGDPEMRRAAREMAKNRAARDQLEETSRRLERAQRDGDTGAQEELRREIERAQRMLRELQGTGAPDGGAGETTPEGHEWSRSAPGLESFKQDFSRWEQLKRDIALALERRDLALASQLKGKNERDRLNAGTVEALSEEYRARIARYFEALARAGRKP